MNILITGSEGTIGKLISNHLSRENNVRGLDKKTGIDLLEDDLSDYFNDIEILIHLAANPDPTIDYKEAQKNIKITKNVIKACDSAKGLNKIINASSINVYPFSKMFDNNKRITKSTHLSQNTVLGKTYYGQAKITVEKLFEDYCKKKDISLLNLRIGYVSSNDAICPIGENPKPFHPHIHLKHSDLIKIINKALTHKGIKSYVCVSKKHGFIDKSIRFPI